VLDIRGFTRFAADHSNRDVVELLNQAHARIVPIVRAHGGVIDKFLGDGLMATFGAVNPSTTPAADALRALDATMTDVAAWRAEKLEQDSAATALDINGAVVAGPLLFAALGAAERLEYTVIGPPANLAAKLEKHNKRIGTRALTLAETLTEAVAQGYVAKPNLRRIRDQHLPDTPDLLNIAVMA
jgi:adenylate cyclase